jgi:endonuclease YncB( thermonuclease family)
MRQSKFTETQIVSILKQAWCWWYRKYAAGDTVLEGFENKAREARKGLWADPQPVPPWEWRRSRVHSRR